MSPSGGWECKNCGYQYTANEAPPCPKCQTSAVIRRVSVTDTLVLKDSIALEKRSEFWKSRPKVQWILRVLGVFPPLAGLLIGGALPIIIGVVTGVIVYILGPRAAYKVIQIERSHS